MRTRAPLRIATRASELALWQSRHVAARLTALRPDIVVELVPLTTAGDTILHMSLAKIGGKGLFIKELEIALIEDRADIAVHSMKDVPVALPAALHIAVMLERDDPRDVLLSPQGRTIGELAPSCRLGTSSLRRRSQLLALRADLDVRDLRGNVPTRIARLARGDFDAIVLAAAGLARLGLLDDGCRYLEPDEVLPAVGQGAIGIECRIDDTYVNDLIAPLNDAATATCVRAERAMNVALGGSCTVPAAGYARLEAGVLTLTGLVAAVDGRDSVRQTASGPAAQAERIGMALGEAMLAAGAARILHDLNEQ